MTNPNDVLAAIKIYVLELLGTRQRDEAEVFARAANKDAGRAEGAAVRAETAEQGATIAVRDEVNKLRGDVPAAFDTLGEIAKELEDNESDRAALTNQIAGKANAEHQHDFKDIAWGGDVAEVQPPTPENAAYELVQRNEEGTIEANNPAGKSDRELVTVDYFNSHTPTVVGEKIVAARLPGIVHTGYGAPSPDMPNIIPGDLYINIGTWTMYRFD